MTYPYVPLDLPQWIQPMVNLVQPKQSEPSHLINQTFLFGQGNTHIMP